MLVQVQRTSFGLVEIILHKEIKNQACGYFGLIGIVNAVAPLPNPLTVSALSHLFKNCVEQILPLPKF